MTEMKDICMPDMQLWILNAKPQPDVKQSQPANQQPAGRPVQRESRFAYLQKNMDTKLPPDCTPEKYGRG